MKILSKIDPKKSTRVEYISAKIIKSCTSSIQGTVANLINITFCKCQFPASLKGAQVVPLHKKNDPLDKENYRPVSILPIYRKSMRGPCIINCLSFLTIFSIPIWQPFVRFWMSVYPAAPSRGLEEGLGQP